MGGSKVWVLGQVRVYRQAQVIAVRDHGWQAGVRVVLSAGQLTRCAGSRRLMRSSSLAGVVSALHMYVQRTVQRAVQPSIAHQPPRVVKLQLIPANPCWAPEQTCPSIMRAAGRMHTACRVAQSALPHPPRTQAHPHLTSSCMMRTDRAGPAGVAAGWAAPGSCSRSSSSSSDAE
jgi:hypothetical protein